MGPDKLAITDWLKALAIGAKAMLRMCSAGDVSLQPFANGVYMSRIIRMKEVTVRVGLSRTTIWRLERRFEFPARVQLSSHAVGYVEEEIDTWILSRPSSERADSLASERGDTVLSVPSSTARMA